jgi:AcrR family transcriptional regulator
MVEVPKERRRRTDGPDAAGRSGRGGSGGTGGAGGGVRRREATVEQIPAGAVGSAEAEALRPHAASMGIRAERSMETRNRVLAVALEQLESGGEAAVRIDEIRDRSGVSIGSIYHHFGDREGVIAAAQLRRFARYAESEITALSDIVERSANVEQFRRAIRQLTRHARSDVRTAQRWGRIGVLASTIGRDDLRADIEQVQTRLTDGFTAHVAQGQARGFFRDDLDPRAIAAFVEAYTLGLALNDVDGRGVGEQAWEQVVWTVLDGLIPEA